MILTKRDLKYYLECDKEMIDRKTKRPRLFGDELWKYTIRLRKLEYYMNNKKNIFCFIMYCFSKFLHHKMSVKLNTEIPPNVFGPGLMIFHPGTITVNDSAKVGCNCHLYSGVNIAEKCVIGDNVYIAPGVKILPNVTIANDIRIGANAVVNKSVTESGITIGGVPAHKLSDKPSLHKRATDFISR